MPEHNPSIPVILALCLGPPALAACVILPLALLRGEVALTTPAMLQGAWVLEQILVDGTEPNHPDDYYTVVEFQGEGYRLHSAGQGLNCERYQERLTGPDGQALTVKQRQIQLERQLRETNDAGALVNTTPRRSRLMVEAGIDPEVVRSMIGQSSGETAGSFAVDTSVSPAVITLRAETGLKHTDTGIYHFKAGRLVMAFPEKSGDPTPKDFQPHPGVVLTVFKRQ